MKKIKLLSLIAFINFNLNAQKNPFTPIENSDGWKTENLLKNNRKIQKMDSMITKGAFKEISSVVIAHNGKVIFENYYNENHSDTKHNTRSATKTITGTLIW